MLRRSQSSLREEEKKKTRLATKFNNTLTNTNMSLRGRESHTSKGIVLRIVRACIYTGAGEAISLIAINVAAGVGVFELILSSEEPLQLKVGVGDDM